MHRRPSVRLSICTEVSLSRPSSSSTGRGVRIETPLSPCFADVFAGDLQIEGVIARDSTPVLLEDRDPESLTAEEARELVRWMRAREDDAVKVKREKRARSSTIEEEDDNDDDEVSEVSSGRQRKRHRASNDSGVEIVDLTED